MKRKSEALKKRVCELFIEVKVVLRLEDITCEGRVVLTVYSERGR